MQALLIAPPAPGADHPTTTKILGRSPLERHLIHLAERGIEHCMVLLPVGSEAIPEPSLSRAARIAGVAVSARREDDDWRGESDFADAVVVVAGNGVYDARLYDAVTRATDSVAIVDGLAAGSEAAPIGLARLPRPALLSGPADRLPFPVPQPGVRTLSVGALPAYLPGLRRTLRPHWHLVRSPADATRARSAILDAAQKGILDFPARFLHPIPENVLARAAAATGVTPNQITIATGLVALVATSLFARQAYGPALAIAFLVNILDGVDGKLARIKLLSSRFGDRLDHVVDVLFEFSWYVGLGWGLSTAGATWTPLWASVSLIAVMIGARAVSGLYRMVSGRQIHDHLAFDRAFRLVAGRRNVYVFVLLVGLAAGRVPEAFNLVVAWGVVTLGVYLARTAMAMGRRLTAAG